MHKLAKLLFPRNPKWVRHRKLQSLLFAIGLTVITCVLVGTVIFLLNQKRGG